MSIENRLAAKKRSKQAKMRRIRIRIIKVVAVLVVLGIITMIGFGIFYSSMKKHAASDKYIKKDGTIDADSALSYVDVADYKNIVVTREDQLPKASEVQNQVDSFVNSNKETIATAGVAIAEKDSVTLSYKVVVDGKEVESKKAESKSYTLGNGTISKDFDKAIAAKKVGDSFSIDVKYGDDEKDETLKGKTASYVGKIEKVTKTPELTDKLVDEKMGKELDKKKFPHTVEGLKQYYGDKLFNTNSDAYIREQIVSTTKVKKYPYFFRLNEEYVQAKNYEDTAAYYVSLGVSLTKYGLAGVKEKDDRAFEKVMTKAAKNSTKNYLAYQAIYEDAKLAKVDEAAIKAFLAKNDQKYEDVIKNSSVPLLACATLQDEVFEYVKTLVKYEGDEKLFWVDDPKEESEEE